MSKTANRASLILLALVGLVCPFAHAGRNQGAAMIVHTIPVTYRTINDYCNDLLFPPPATCQEAVTRCDTDDYGAVMWVLAAFPEGSSPGVTAFEFGIYHNLSTDAFLYKSGCGPGLLEIPGEYWPESGTGTACAYGRPLYPTGPMKMYWFIMDGFDGAYFSTGVYPYGNEGAALCDDSSPPVLDRCYLFGTMRWRADGENQCPTEAHLGACCFASGNCTFGSPSDCQSSGGSYQGDNVPCEPNPCPSGISACCFEDGHCEMLLAAACAAQGGISHPGSTCATYDCPYSPPPTACCFQDGHCEMLTPDECTAHGGTSHWNWTCDPNVCPQPTGACCIGEVCHQATHRQCQDQGGEWQGPGAPCEPNPCLSPPPVPEACCFSDGHCEDLLADECRASGGTPQGEGTRCDTVHCMVTPTKSTTWGGVKAAYR